MGRARSNLLNKRFGRWTVIGDAGNKNGSSYWLCKCDCGNKKIVKGTLLTRGNSKSCGCYNSDLVKKRNISKTIYSYHTHSTDDRLYRIYYGILTRCLNAKSNNYKDYMGRGITVCIEWKESYESFRKWSLENGYKENLSIDRINNDGNYEPSNCRWVNKKIQANNRRSTRKITYKGITKPCTEWSKITGLKEAIIISRLNSGWSEEKTLETPLYALVGIKYHNGDRANRKKEDKKTA